MTADEIRSQFGHNAVYAQQFDEGALMCLHTLALGELAAQLAEYNAAHKHSTDTQRQNTSEAQPATVYDPVLDIRVPAQAYTGKRWEDMSEAERREWAGR